ncbi:unnamed protein product [Echinostoma caproni]|uniref:OAR domain-containing protein n=1 Tax=Echinostoma caproni TaxID=27848 RepID=A0A183AKL5_9TREM|nr:unnamed protein product [Echinostoma caproni]
MQAAASRHLGSAGRGHVPNDMVLDSLCNGLGRSSSVQFPNPLQASGLLNGPNSSVHGSSSPGPAHSSPTVKAHADAFSTYNLRCHNLKDFRNTAAAALVAAVAGEQVQFAAHVANNIDGSVGSAGSGGGGSGGGGGGGTSGDVNGGNGIGDPGDGSGEPNTSEKTLDRPVSMDESDGAHRGQTANTSQPGSDGLIGSMILKPFCVAY